MPAKSQKQRMAIAIAEHDPQKLYARNSAMTSMSQQQLHDFSSTPQKGLPMKVKPHSGFRSVEKAVADRPPSPPSSRKMFQGISKPVVDSPVEEAQEVAAPKLTTIKRPKRVGIKKSGGMQNPFSGLKSKKGWG